MYKRQAYDGDADRCLCVDEKGNVITGDHILYIYGWDVYKRQDDESPDSCGKMCDDYEKMDTRIKVVHKKNGGLSDARNAGMKVMFPMAKCLLSGW